MNTYYSIIETPEGELDLVELGKFEDYDEAVDEAEEKHINLVTLDQQELQDLKTKILALTS